MIPHALGPCPSASTFLATTMHFADLLGARCAETLVRHVSRNRVMHRLCAFTVLDKQLIGEFNFAFGLTRNVNYGQLHFVAFATGLVFLRA